MNVFEELKNKLDGKIKKMYVPNPKMIYVTVDKKDLKESAKIVFRDMDARYVVASGMENFENFEILYHFAFDKQGTFVSLRVYLEKDNIEVDSLVEIIPGIEFIEREMWELLGISFKGNPNLKHLLLPDDWPQGDYPLRKCSNDK